MDSDITVDGHVLIFKCPHCYDFIMVRTTEVNCTIFRHAVFKGTDQPVSPHLPEEQCELLVENDSVYGCCKPFRLDLVTMKVFKCEYI